MAALHQSPGVTKATPAIWPHSLVTLIRITNIRTHSKHNNEYQIGMALWLALTATRSIRIRITAPIRLCFVIFFPFVPTSLSSKVFTTLLLLLLSASSFCLVLAVIMRERFYVGNTPRARDLRPLQYIYIVNCLLHFESNIGPTDHSVAIDNRLWPRYNSNALWRMPPCSAMLHN